VENEVLKHRCTYLLVHTRHVLADLISRWLTDLTDQILLELKAGTGGSASKMDGVGLGNAADK